LPTSRAVFAHAKIVYIFEGTSEIQRMIIGQSITGLDMR
jgi:alkylation response protein AidB-like acyl-CoA dehydrogenase